VSTEHSCVASESCWTFPRDQSEHLRKTFLFSAWSFLAWAFIFFHKHRICFAVLWHLTTLFPLKSTQSFSQAAFFARGWHGIGSFAFNNGGKSLPTPAPLPQNNHCFGDTSHHCWKIPPPKTKSKFTASEGMQNSNVV